MNVDKVVEYAAMVERLLKIASRCSTCGGEAVLTVSPKYRSGFEPSNGRPWAYFVSECKVNGSYATWRVGRTFKEKITGAKPDHTFVLLGKAYTDKPA